MKLEGKCASGPFAEQGSLEDLTQELESARRLNAFLKRQIWRRATEIKHPKTDFVSKLSRSFTRRLRGHRQPPDDGLGAVSQAALGGIDWKKVEAERATSSNGLSSIVVRATRTDTIHRLLLSIFEHEAGEEFEVIVASDCREIEQHLAIFPIMFGNFKYVSVPRDAGSGTQLNLAFLKAKGSRVIFIDESVEVAPEWLRTLVKPLEDRGVVAVRPQLIGAVGQAERSPVPALRAPANIVQSVTLVKDAPEFCERGVPCFAVRSTDFAAASGFDRFVDARSQIEFCARLGQPGRQFATALDSCVLSQVATPAGVEIDVADLDTRTVARAPAERKIGASAIRTQPRSVSIKIACPRAQKKEYWGDYHFAVSLAAAFMRQGVRARVEFRDLWPASSNDADVNLVLRGLSPFNPPMKNNNLIWVISHPDDVPVSELDGFDVVFGASEHWCRTVASLTKSTVVPLLQCSDSHRFYIRPRNGRFASHALFIANSRGVKRTVVRHAIDYGIPLDIYGHGWKTHAPRQWVKGKNIANIDLPMYYSNADVVLNDHWDDMRESGFVSNRIFDALACGAPVVTDAVAAMPEDLASHCVIFRSAGEFKASIETAIGRTTEARSAAACRLIHEKHSFDCRAATILKCL